MPGLCPARDRAGLGLERLYVIGTPCSDNTTTARPFIADGGLETTLVFIDGIYLPDFAAFPLLETEEGRAALTRYYTPYLDIAEQMGTGIVLDTATWRANLDWGARLGYDALTVPDHLSDVLAPVPALVSAAEATHRLRVGTNVLNND